jgi:hypothetical protein
MSVDRTRHDALARITGNTNLARAVPQLRPEVLHAVITHYGLPDCAELLTLATAQQLSAVFDLDLWRASRAGGDERFDVTRFCEWLEVLVEVGPAIAAARLADMDAELVVAGLSPHIRVFDPGAFSTDGETSGVEPVLNAGRERGLHAEIGGYLVVARRPDAWASIVEVLLALAECHGDMFHSVMRACRRLSNAGFELDGLDDLLSDGEQAHFDLSVSREQRREHAGFLPPEQARAFLDSARHASFTMPPPRDHPVFVAYQRGLAMSQIEPRSALSSATLAADEVPADSAAAVASVIDVLRAAGALADTPRALLPGARDESTSVHPALSRYLTVAASSDDEWTARNHELAFLANALVGACSVQGRSFTRRDAVDAVAATCNLGLEYWPPQWPPATQHDLVTVFQTGWSILHDEVSMAAAAQLQAVLDQVRVSDRHLQLELQMLRRDLEKSCRSRMPWRVRDGLDALATFDLPAWAAMTALFDQCPVMLANVYASGDRRLHTVNPSEWRFIANARDIDAVRSFLGSLADLLTR